MIKILVASFSTVNDEKKIHEKEIEQNQVNNKRVNKNSSQINQDTSYHRGQQYCSSCLEKV